MITESVNDNEEIQEVSARFEEPIEVNVQTISSVDDDDDDEEEESKSIHSNEENNEKPLVANEKVEEKSKSDETDHADALPPKYEDEFKEATFEEVTDENHNKENEVKTEVILPPMEVGGT